jgi:hypothetical protein
MADVGLFMTDGRAGVFYYVLLSTTTTSFPPIHRHRDASKAGLGLSPSWLL